MPHIEKGQKTKRSITAPFGAGDGNRTHAASLEGWNSTIEQHPHLLCLNILSHLKYFVKMFFKNTLRFYNFKSSYTRRRYVLVMKSARMVKFIKAKQKSGCNNYTKIRVLKRNNTVSSFRKCNLRFSIHKTGILLRL